MITGECGRKDFIENLSILFDKVMKFTGLLFGPSSTAIRSMYILYSTVQRNSTPMTHCDLANVPSVSLIGYSYYSKKKCYSELLLICGGKM